MKICGLLILKNVSESKLTSRSRRNIWCKYLSSSRLAEEVCTDQGERTAWKALWETESKREMQGRLQQSKAVGAGRESFKHGVRRRSDLDKYTRVARHGNLQVGIRDDPLEEEQLSAAVDRLDYLVQQGCLVDDSHFCAVLKRCAIQQDSVVGSRVHALAVKSGLQSSTFLANHLICMYASDGRLFEATQVFTHVPEPDRYMWASIILAYARHGKPTEALELYRRMHEATVAPDNHIYVAVLKACAAVRDLSSGKDVHAHILSGAVESCGFVGSSLVDMYSKCGSIEDARRLFERLPLKNVVTWTAMIAGYADMGLFEEALSLYASMQREGVTRANRVTFVCLLQACSSAGTLCHGERLHAQIRDRGLDCDVVVGSCLVDMYAKCGNLEQSRHVFNSLPIKNVVTWTAMITGYSQRGLGHEALSMLDSMQQEGVTPNAATWNAIIAGYTEHGLGQDVLTLYARMQRHDMVQANSVTFACLLKACASIGALQQGKQLHAEIQERGLEADAAVGSCLVDMYAKCGSLEDACKVFSTLSTKDVVTWNALINAYGQRNEGTKAMCCFLEMQQCGVDPDGTTFISLLTACSHEGLVHEGRNYFRMMTKDYGILPEVDHYNCMVDLLGRSGLVDEAEEMLVSMPFESDAVGWMSLLNACKTHMDVARGERCFAGVTKLEPQNGAAYMLMEGIYEAVGRRDDVNRLKRMRKAAGACKKPAGAYIEVGSKTHAFLVGEERDDVSSKLRSVNGLVSAGGGHVPHTELMLKQVSDGEKDDDAGLCGHAEKLALAYGLLNTPEGTPLVVTKNLRMCGHCHSSTKVMSRLEKRKIIVRDAHRVHQFEDGCCSCGDRH